MSENISSNTFTYSISEIEDAVHWLLEQVKNHKLWLLNGDLGAGKTTFVAALGKVLQFNETVNSPTFSLINQYTFNDKYGNEQIVYHADLYRLENEESAVNAGIEDIIYDTDAIRIIEWPEKAIGLFPTNNFVILTFTILNEQTRTINITIK